MKPLLGRRLQALRGASFCLVLLFVRAAPAAAEEGVLPKVELFGGYSYLRSEGHNLNGWKAVVAVNVNRWFGLAADFDGHYRSETTPLGEEKESEHSFTFGPHFALRRKKLVPFAYTLFGMARESVSVAGISESATGFATELGGGLDYDVTERMAIRLLDASASITRIDEHTHVKPKLAFGLVFHFGRKESRHTTTGSH